MMTTENIEEIIPEKDVMWKRYFMHISYDGTEYHGWQRQLTGNTVQEEIEAALRKLLRQERIISVGCGRTDAGVHARNFFLHFNAEKPIENIEEIFFKLNMMLPKDIGLFDLWLVDNLAHARFDAIERSYEYHMHQVRDPFVQRYSTFFPWKLDVDKMNQAAAILLEYKDFAAFCKTGGGNKTTLCDLRRAEWIRKGNKLVFHITSDRFLRNMVRSVVGTLVAVGRNKMNLEEFKKVIESGDRNEAGDSMTGRGLHLTEIFYPGMSCEYEPKLPVE